MRSWNQLWLAAATAVALLTGGCMGSPDDPVVASRSPVLTDATPLPVIAQEVWTEVPAGCEGLIRPDLELGVAEGAPSLVGVIADSGDVSCVDSFESIEKDLVGMGAGTTAERIRESYQLTRGDPHALMGQTGGRVGDPSPQPNHGSPRDAIHDPTVLRKLVRVEEASSDPSPQPNDEDPTDPSP